jgi:hypothetical protein
MPRCSIACSQDSGLVPTHPFTQAFTHVFLQVVFVVGSARDFLQAHCSPCRPLPLGFVKTSYQSLPSRPIRLWPMAAHLSLSALEFDSSLSTRDFLLPDHVYPILLSD